MTGAGDAVATVCIDCRYIGPRPSGIAEVVRGLVDHLPGLAPDLRFLLLRHPAHPGSLSDAPNVAEQVVAHPANGPATMWWLPRVADLTGVDLFHATFNTMPAGLAMPCVVTIHDIMRLTNPGWCRTGLRGAVEQGFYGHGLRRAIRSADAIAAISGATASAVAAFHPPAAARTAVTLSGVSARFRPGITEPARLAALGLTPGRPFVLTVGQDAPYKNHPGVMRAFAIAFGADPRIDLVIVQRRGRGSGALDRLARDLGIAGRVRFLPAVDTDALVMLYQAACVLLHPSFAEGFGNPVAEAMACGCPVVTSDTSAMPEVAGGAALLADPHDSASIADRLLAVMRDPALAAGMRAAGLVRVQSLQWRDFALANLAIYRRVLARGPARYFGQRFSRDHSVNVRT
ncbi:glycosyltransferase family 1 protein [Sphingomonas sp.]|uniref:glycosyltransferase family 4 protein n=1 Tax=Sphingomonas sp. TaxID=28214 RepID=UPI002CAB91E9|nr:glycosyltransferase family 1 protein [Sphingomonas sp.]HTG38419.1 glycosyltransferase family 1 protein [Sphingomonas sp.]